MLDILIKGGTVVDGTGGASQQADLGIRDGRIVAIGAIDEEATETVDATGKIVAPGFVDVHTHYDAQAFWDGTLSPSPFHGVTSVVGGNCGFSIAPLSPDAGEYLMKMLSRVEGMPLEALEEGVSWNWQSFGEYLDQLEGRLSINAGFMVGHSAIRRTVMGERAVGSEATEEELAAMVKLLRDSMEEGGMGFSSTISSTHNDFDGNPVPSRHASKHEILTLARQVRDFEGTTVEFLPGVGWGEEEANYMADISLAANRPVNWNVLVPNSQNIQHAKDQLAATDIARARGAEVIALTVPQPMTIRINLDSGFVFDALHNWSSFFQLGKEEKIAFLRDPVKRKKFGEDAQNPESPMHMLANWDNFTIDQTQKESLKQYCGRRVGEIAEELGKTSFDAMIDIAIEDDLQTYFMPPSMGEDDETWKMRGELWHDDRTIIGASDAGAHLDMLDAFALTTHLLSDGVRKFGLISLEEAVHQITEKPARLFGLRERGRVEEGYRADLVVFDPDTIASGPVYTRTDLPAGAGRLYADAIGVDHVLVGGTPIVTHGEFTGALPGEVLRSGRDTDTVTP